MTNRSDTLITPLSEAQAVLEYEVETFLRQPEELREIILHRSLDQTFGEIAKEISARRLDGSSITESAVRGQLDRASEFFENRDPKHLREIILAADKELFMNELEERGMMLVGDELLTRMETDAFLLLGKGYSLSKVARLLHVRYKYFADSVNNTNGLYAKLGVRTYSEAGALARKDYPEKVQQTVEVYTDPQISIGNSTLNPLDGEILLMLGAGLSREQIEERLSKSHVKVEERIRVISNKIVTDGSQDIGTYARNAFPHLVQAKRARLGIEEHGKE